MPKNNILTWNFSSIFERDSEKGAVRAVMRAVFYMASGFLSSRAIIFGKCAPFGIAATAAVESGDGVFVLVGTVIGYILPAGPEYPLRYVAAAGAVFLLKWVLSGFEGLAAHPAFAPALAAVLSGMTGIAVVLAGGGLPYDFIIFLTETLLCGFGAVFLGQAFRYLSRPSSLWGLSQRELISVTISICIMLLSLERIQFSGISIGRIAAIIAILCAARFGGETGGAIMGIAAGIVMSLGNSSMAIVLAGYGFGGLIAGIFSQFGRVWCVAAFILADAVAVITTFHSTAETLTTAYEAAVAATIFLLVPEKILCRISGVFVPLQNPTDNQILCNVSERLIASAETLEDISEMVSSIHLKLSRFSSNDISTVYDSTAESICVKCGMHMYCWGTVYNDTMNALDDITGMLKKNKSVTRDDIPKHFASRCCKLSEFISTINRCFAEYTARKAADIKTEQLRRLIAPGFYNAASLMRDIASDFSTVKKRTEGDGRVRAAFASCGITVKSSQLFVDSHGRLSIEAETEDSRLRVSREKLLEAISTACGRKMTGPRVTDSENGTMKLLFSQKTRFSVKFGEATIQKTGETLCGDACDSFVDEHGRALLILSDGMGCGGSAAVDSNLTVGLMSRLLRCGFGFDEAARIASYAILTKSDEESFSTLDIACIDLYDGIASFIKAGAPPTYVRRCGRVERVEPCSMPIGILPDIKLEKTNIRLHQGDVIVVVSDGVIADGDSFVIREIERFSGEPRAFARSLAKKAKEQRSDGHDDDITVLVAAVS